MLAKRLIAASGVGGGGGFNPLLYSPLVFYDPADVSTLWQDESGTIPVTANGQMVKRMDDLSGNGYHATDSVGLEYQNGMLVGNGSNRGLVATIPTIAYPFYMLGVVDRNSAASSAFSISNPAVQDRSYGIGSETTTLFRSWVYNTSFNQTTISNANQKALLTGKFITGSQTLAVNGGTESSAMNIAAPTGCTDVGIGILNRPVKIYYNGAYGGFLLFDYALTTTDRESVEQWLIDRYSVPM